MGESTNYSGYSNADLPVGLERADGEGGRLGTATTAGAIVVSNDQWVNAESSVYIKLEESPDSPQVERAEQMTVTHKWVMGVDEALYRMTGLYRGLVRTGTDRFFLTPEAWKVLSATMSTDKGERATITLVEECLTSDTPPDKFSVVPVELGLNIIKHPRYFWAFVGPEGYGSETELINQMVIRFLQDYMESPNAAYRQAISKLIADSMGTYGSTSDADPVAKVDKDNNWTWPTGSKISGTDEAKAAALEIITKYWRGEETPYIVGWQLDWTVFYAYPQYLNPGGYIENPVTEAMPSLPSYFWHPGDPWIVSFPSPSNTIFSLMSWLNPQSYAANGLRGGPLNISWLRRADQVDYERIWFGVHMQWTGSAVGVWDADLYNQNDGPQYASDFRWATSG